jgi:acyl-coenzyme A synthetase/AMP-(fatty) acid ligase
MIYVNDTHHDEQYFERCFALFDRHPLLRRCQSERFAVCLSYTAFWIALCLYVKERGGSVYPLPIDIPIDAARRRAERSGSRHLIFGTDGEAAVERVEAIERSTEPSLDDGQPALIQTSSGTTGEPKHIARSWASIDTEIASYVQHFDASEMTPIVACPVNHSYGLISGVLVALKRGLQPVIVTNPNPKYILRKLSEAASPLLYSSPTLIATTTMLAPEDKPIFAIMASGTLLPKPAFESIRKKVRHLHQQYGCSEVGCVTLGQDIAAANEVGRPLRHIELAAGGSASEPREIVVKSGAKTVETRDLGYLKDGKLCFVSRIDDMINVSGLNVYPSEVEEVVLEMPEVADAVVFKRSHGLGTEQVCLHFVSDRPLPHRQIREHCAKKLASYQVPMRIAQVEVIPKLPNGKINRRDLAEASERREAALLSNQRASS